MLDAEHTFVELVQRLEDGVLVSHYIVLEPPRNPSPNVVSDGGACWDSENLRCGSVKARHRQKLKEHSHNRVLQVYAVWSLVRTGRS